jgi:hypothetical protein
MGENAFSSDVKGEGLKTIPEGSVSYTVIAQPYKGQYFSSSFANLFCEGRKKLYQNPQLLNNWDEN